MENKKKENTFLVIIWVRNWRRGGVGMGRKHRMIAIIVQREAKVAM